jgi:hypothetical protein
VTAKDKMRGKRKGGQKGKRGRRDVLEASEIEERLERCFIASSPRPCKQL